MLRLPARFAAVILCFAPLFRQLTWRHAQVLLIGAILVPSQRTVTSILRISGLCWERRFVNYHRVLNRAAWSGRAAARVLLGLLLQAFVPKGAVLAHPTMLPIRVRRPGNWQPRSPTATGSGRRRARDAEHHLDLVAVDFDTTHDGAHDLAATVPVQTVEPSVDPLGKL